ncbi:hypothetical protein GQ600_11224 [Phytophthora cactorum]|nr:hypothetical protein GQ600_11224 [Phytophthora cactorum]
MVLLYRIGDGIRADFRVAELRRLAFTVNNSAMLMNQLEEEVMRLSNFRRLQCSIPLPRRRTTRSASLMPWSLDYNAVGLVHESRIQSCVGLSRQQLGTSPLTLKKQHRSNS